MPVATTGNALIDTATAEIAGALRDGDPGKRDQYYYDEAMRLRDEIIAGALERADALPPWRAAVNGTGKRPWFLIRGSGIESDKIPLAHRYHNGPSGKLVCYASYETATRAAVKLNTAPLLHKLGMS
jgi:hypothetical protein